MTDSRKSRPSKRKQASAKALSLVEVGGSHAGAGNLFDSTRIYKHPKRPEWGMAVVSEWVQDRVRFTFEDTQVRAFKANMLNVLDVVDLPEAEAAELRSRLTRKKASGAAARKAVKVVTDR